MKLNYYEIDFLIFGHVDDGFNPNKYKIIERSPWTKCLEYEVQFVIFKYKKKFWKFIYSRTVDVILDDDGSRYWDCTLTLLNGVKFRSDRIYESEAYEVEKILSPEVVIRWEHIHG